jgi:hypothetical protein
VVVQEAENGMLKGHIGRLYYMIYPILSLSYLVVKNDSCHYFLQVKSSRFECGFE